MKIRIHNNSLRLRLTQPEVRQFEETGRVEARVRFGPAATETLVYSLERTKASEMGASFASSHIRVFVPEAMSSGWTATDQVGMEHSMDLGNGEALRILVEKDFKCLTERAGEDESDHFPNPSEHC